jgi:hypothetical protein
MCPDVPDTSSVVAPHVSVPVITIPVWKYENVSGLPRQGNRPLYVEAPTGTGARR